MRYSLHDVKEATHLELLGTVIVMIVTHCRSLLIYIHGVEFKPETVGT